MAARNLAPFSILDRDAVGVFGGGTGASASNMTAILGAGVVSITRGASAGLYTINLADKWNKLLFAGFEVIDPTTTKHWEVAVVSEDVASGKTIVIQAFSAAGAAAPAASDLTTDEKLKFMLILSNTGQVPSAR